MTLASNQQISPDACSGTAIFQREKDKKLLLSSLEDLRAKQSFRYTSMLQTRLNASDYLTPLTIASSQKLSSLINDFIEEGMSMYLKGALAIIDASNVEDAIEVVMEEE